jgi:L-lactate dehydrogenase complex protein LldG
VSAAREVVLGRIRAALEPAPEAAEVPRAYRLRGVRGPAEVAELFVERVEETGAHVRRAGDVPAAVAAVLAEQGAGRVVVPRDLPASLRPAGVELVEDDLLSPDELDALDGVVTACAAACAETGTIAFDAGPGQGRRAASLVPDLHVVVLGRDQIVETVPELFEQLAPSARDGRPLVLVSGPSATSDIGFERVEGVHGPRRLVVVLADEPGRGGS